jgi:hypothetical protein
LFTIIEADKRRVIKAQVMLNKDWGEIIKYYYAMKNRK